MDTYVTWTADGLPVVLDRETGEYCYVSYADGVAMIRRAPAAR